MGQSPMEENDEGFVRRALAGSDKVRIIRRRRAGTGI